MQQQIGFALAHERVVDAERQRGNARPQPREFAENPFARSPGDHAAFDRNDKRQLRSLADGLRIERFDPTHVDDPHFDAFPGKDARGFLRFAHHTPECENRRAGSLTHKPAFRQLERFRIHGNLDTFGFAPRIPDRKRTTHRKRCAQRAGKLRLVRGSEHRVYAMSNIP